MGDRLRQLLYPLVLPVIVGTVWVCGWVRQQEDRTEHTIFLGPNAVTQQASGPLPRCGPDDVLIDSPQEALATMRSADADEP